MKTLVDALAKIDKVEREISGIRPKELREAIRGYANAQRELIEALRKFDRPLQVGGAFTAKAEPCCGAVVFASRATRHLASAGSKPP